MNAHLKSLQMQVFDRIARMMGALSAPARLRILQVLAQGPRTVESLAEATQLSVANTSMHLQKMAREGLVNVTRQGVSRVYAVASPTILAVWEKLQDLTHEIDPWMEKVENEITDPSLRAPSNGAEVLKEVRSGKAVLLDVRFENESRSTPIPHAMTVPHEELGKRSHELPKNKTLYLICRGRYCPQATEAVQNLRKKGFKAYRLRHSPFRLLQEWRVVR